MWLGVPGFRSWGVPPHHPGRELDVGGPARLVRRPDALEDTFSR